MNKSMDTDIHISNMIDETFEFVRKAYKYHNASIQSTQSLDCANTHSRLIFPKTKNGKTRISEQELRFAFVEIFNRYVEQKGLNWFYSVEMPTRGDYSFSGKGNRNALFDLSIIDSSFNRIALIEFKANNPGKECYAKDLMKLTNPEEEDSNTLKYFVQIVENYTGETIDSINKKTEIENQSITKSGNPVHVRVYSLSKGEEIINKISY